MVETTDKIMGDTNNLIPRVIKRGSVDISSYSAYGTLVRGTATVVLDDILSKNNNIIECYYYASGGGVENLIKINYNVSDATFLPSLNVNFYLSKTTYNSNDVVQINIEHIRSSAITRTIYYVVYSSSFYDGVILWLRQQTKDLLTAIKTNQE